jgi:hypothetical protein
VKAGTDLDALIATEPIQLVEQLKHSSLHLAIAALLRVEPLRADGVELVDEDDGRSFLLCKLESVADKLCAIANKHLHQRRAR